MKALPNCLIDLHLHLDGSISPKTARLLAEMQDIDIPADDAELQKLLSVDASCRDLNTYLEKFAFPCKLLQSKEGLTTAVACLLGELEAQGVLYAEIRFAPQKSTACGLTQAKAVQAAIDGMKTSNIRANLILCCMRGDDNRSENVETLRVAKQFLGKGVCAVDLAGAEALFPTEDYADLFALARSLKLPYTIHAGEAAGAESVAMALELGASRIGHGVRAVEDACVLQALAAKKIPLELCPTSNLNTAVFDSLADFPLLKLMEAGVRVTVNTDNLTVSATTLRDEFAKLTETFALTTGQQRELLLNAAEASFADADTKMMLISRITEAFSA